MKFEEVMPYMREGKKVIRKSLSHPIFISDYTNSFGETYKAFCFHGNKYINYYEITQNDLFAEDWEVIGRVD